MNVWKYTYIKFYQFRRETLAGDYTAMLFVVELDFCVYSGIVFLIDGLTGYNSLLRAFVCTYFTWWRFYSLDDS